MRKVVYEWKYNQQSWVEQSDQEQRFIYFDRLRILTFDPSKGGQ